MVATAAAATVVVKKKGLDLTRHKFSHFVNYVVFPRCQTRNGGKKGRGRERQRWGKKKWGD